MAELRRLFQDVGLKEVETFIASGNVVFHSEAKDISSPRSDNASLNWAVAQFAYIVLFSYSFFFEGLTGLTITIGAIITLALLMITTAKVTWVDKFASKPTQQGFPPPIPNV